MANKKQQLEVPAIPSLGFAPQEYERSYFAEINGALNGYFRSLISTMGALFGIRGGKFMNNPYGAFQDSTDQVAANTTTAYPITFNTTDFSNGVTIASSSRITVADSGIWNIQFSIQLSNSTITSQNVDVWFRVNGTNVANSNRKFGVSPRIGIGDPFNTVAAMNYFLTLNANDYVEIMWRPTDVGVTLEQYAASSTPTRPAVPSAIATLSFVSNLPTI